MKSMTTIGNIFFLKLFLGSTCGMLKHIFKLDFDKNLGSLWILTNNLLVT